MAMMSGKQVFGGIPEAQKSVDFRKISPELLKQAQENVETWKDSFDTVLGDLQEAEAEEHMELMDGDPRMMIVNLCAMRLDQAKEAMKELKSN
jgi:hypothetical protein